ncbi:MAG: hypothetical protein GDA43_24225 [Hormoscilla sp. SP5CHS1]|nr:hypothetical protein [Hormoscilla sp. SP5CHS1]
MTTTIDIGTMIVSTPEICGGVRELPGGDFMEYESLTLAQVHAALVYYHANKDEIEAYLAEAAAEYEQLLVESREGKL